MVIYKIHCEGNNKNYIGLTTLTLKERKTRHLSVLRLDRHHNPYLQNSYNKYGEDSLSFHVLEEGEDLKDLNKKETIWIKKLNTITPNGFNCNYGGDSHEVSDETKEKLKMVAKNIPNEVYEKGAKKRQKPVGMYTLEKRFIRGFISAKKASEYLNVVPANINSSAREQSYAQGYLWKYLNDDWNYDTYNGRIGKMVWQYTKQGKLIKSYKSLKQAQKETGLNKNAIAGVANGNRKSHKGYIFSYEKKNDLHYKNNNMKKIDQYTKDGEYIKTFESVKEAANAVNTYSSGISACLMGIYETYKGYKWNYHE